MSARAVRLVMFFELWSATAINTSGDHVTHPSSLVQGWVDKVGLALETQHVRRRPWNEACTETPNDTDI